MAGDSGTEQSAADKADASCISRRRSVAGIAFDGASFLLAKRKNSGQQGGRWEFIGGKAEDGETLHEALIREFKEETGFSISVGDLVSSAEFENNEGSVNLYAFSVALPADFSIKGAVFPEHTELGWFSLEEIAALNLVDSDRKLLPGLEKWLVSKA